MKQGDEALEKKHFRIAIKYYGDANRSDLVKKANSKASQHWRNEAGHKAAKTKDIESMEEAIANLEEAKKYEDEPAATDAIIAEIKKDIADEKKRRARIPQRVQRAAETPPPPAPATPTCADFGVVIKIVGGKKKIYSKGDQIKVVAKSESDTGVAIDCTGRWKPELGLWVKDRSRNPALVEITTVPSNGIAKLSFLIDGKGVATAEIKITP